MFVFSNCCTYLELYGMVLGAAALDERGEAIRMKERAPILVGPYQAINQHANLRAVSESVDH